MVALRRTKSIKDFVAPLLSIFEEYRNSFDIYRQLFPVTLPYTYPLMYFLTLQYLLVIVMWINDRIQRRDKEIFLLKFHLKSDFTSKLQAYGSFNTNSLQYFNIFI